MIDPQVGGATQHRQFARCQPEAEGDGSVKRRGYHLVGDPRRHSTAGSVYSCMHGAAS